MNNVFPATNKSDNYGSRSIFILKLFLRALLLHQLSCCSQAQPSSTGLRKKAAAGQGFERPDPTECPLSFLPRDGNKE